MTYHWIIPLTAALLNGVLGVLVLLHDHRRVIHRMFALLSGMLVLWNLNIFVLYLLRDETSALFWSQFFRVGTLMAAPVAAHMFILFGDSRFRYARIALWVSYALASILVVLNAFGLLVTNLEEHAWGYYPVGSVFYLLVPISVGFGLIVSIGVLLHVIHTTHSARKRQQARLWIAGTAIAWPLAMTNLIAPLGIPFYPLGNFANAVYAMFIAYGIRRYRLMDIDSVVTKGISYVFLGGLLLAPALGLVLLLQRWFFEKIDYDFTFFVLVMMLCVGLAMPRMRVSAEERIERSLFPDKHEHRTALRVFTKNIVRILDRERLLDELVQVLSKTLRLESVAVFLLSEPGEKYRLTRSFGEGVSASAFEVTHPLMECLKGRGQALLRAEAEDYGDAWKKMSLAVVFAENCWEVCVGLMVSDRLLGFLALGPKLDSNSLSALDLDLLETLAGEAAIALDNARLYDEIRRSRDVLQRAGRLSAVGTLAAGIAHEIRNPLVSIQTFFQLAPQRLHDDEFITEFLKLTEGEVKRICRLITELLNFAKSPTRTMTNLEMSDVIAGAVTLLVPQARRAGVDLASDAGQCVIVRADSDQLKQVLVNVILNAIEATPVGGRVRVSVVPVTRRGQPFCEIRVQDTGCGIGSECCEEIFTPFFTTKSTGTGLGLSVADQIVREHGGLIAVDSVEGEGSIFSIILPLEEVDEGLKIADSPI
jgi:two-component system NtrC family sensor kinase